MDDAWELIYLTAETLLPKSNAHAIVHHTIKPSRKAGVGMEAHHPWLRCFGHRYGVSRVGVSGIVITKKYLGHSGQVRG